MRLISGAMIRLACSRGSDGGDWREIESFSLYFAPSPVSERLEHAKTVGSLSNDDGDENVKRAIGLISKTAALHVQQTFCTFLCLPCTTKK